MATDQDVHGDELETDEGGTLIRLQLQFPVITFQTIDLIVTVSEAEDIDELTLRGKAKFILEKGKQVGLDSMPGLEGTEIKSLETALGTGYATIKRV